MPEVPETKQPLKPSDDKAYVSKLHFNFVARLAQVILAIMPLEIVSNIFQVYEIRVQNQSAM